MTYPPPPPQGPQQPYRPGYPAQPYPVQPPPKKSPVWPWILLVVVLAVFGLGFGFATTSSDKSVGGHGKAAAVGTPVRDGQLEFVMTRVYQGATTMGTGFWKEDAKGEYVMVHIKVTNTGKEQRSYDSDNQKLLDDKGHEYTSTLRAADALPDNGSGFGDDLNPGFSVERIVVFDLPKSTVPATIVFRDSAFSRGTKVALK